MQKINLKDILVPSDLRSRPKVHDNPNSTCYSSAKCNNATCTKEFRYPHSGQTFNVNRRIICAISVVVYMLKCPFCLMCVGKAKWQFTISERKSTIRRQDWTSPAAKHFLQHSHKISSVHFQGIEKVHGNKWGGNLDLLLLECEAIWIHKHCQTMLIFCFFLAESPEGKLAVAVQVTQMMNWLLRMWLFYRMPRNVRKC